MTLFLLEDETEVFALSGFGALALACLAVNV
jgi:hypothetical protein